MGRLRRESAAWDAAFLDCDYIGAKWYWHEAGVRVGNGGFSLRSRKLLAALQDPRIVLVDVEDTTIGRTFRPLLEREHGIRFGDEALADRFSFEAAYPIGKPFGFHGLFNFCRTVPPAEIAALAPAFSDEIARSPQLLALLRNCVALGQWDAARAIARRILAASPGPRRGTGDARAGERDGGAARGRRPQRTLSLRQRKEIQALPWRARQRTSTAASRNTTPTRIARAALAAHQRGDLDAAERGYRDALATDTRPSDRDALSSASSCTSEGRSPKRCRCSNAPSRRCRRSRSSTTTWGSRSRPPIAPDEAIAAYRRALELTPITPSPGTISGSRCRRNNRLPEAIDAFRAALALAPDFAQAHWNLALALLAHGEFEEGWREYEWRLAHPNSRVRARGVRAALGRRRAPRAARCSSRPSRASATRCNSSASRSRSPSAARACS